MVFHRREAFFLFVGDIVIFYVALFVTLFLRYGFLVNERILSLHLIPFSILFVSWSAVFFIAGLYEQHTLMFQKRLPQKLLGSIFANAVIAALFFYFFPSFLITPRANLFLYLIVSSAFLFLWRRRGFAFFGAREKQPALLLGNGVEMRELEAELFGNPRYGVRLVSAIDFSKPEVNGSWEEIFRGAAPDQTFLIIIDLRNGATESKLPRLYALLFSGVKFVDLYKVYEEIFGRVPLSLLRYDWFLENISATKRYSHNLLKRAMDIAVSLPLFALSLLFYPFIALAIKLDDGGAIFIMQKRVGQNSRPIRTYKFRSLRDNETDPTKQSDNKVTRVGAFLRSARLDELPQFFSVLRGDISLIGPRPELPAAVRQYTDEIPYYNVRHLIKPGLSGWAQIYHENHPHHRTDVSETKVKLSYDLYYLKNRSLFLDFKIALKTIKILLSRSGV